MYGLPMSLVAEINKDFEYHNNDFQDLKNFIMDSYCDFYFEHNVEDKNGVKQLPSDRRYVKVWTAEIWDTGEGLNIYEIINNLTEMPIAELDEKTLREIWRDNYH